MRTALETCLEARMPDAGLSFGYVIRVVNPNQLPHYKAMTMWNDLIPRVNWHLSVDPTWNVIPCSQAELQVEVSSEGIFTARCSHSMMAVLVAKCMRELYDEWQAAEIITELEHLFEKIG